MDTESSLPLIVRRQALLRIRHRKRSKDAVMRTIKAQIAILMRDAPTLIFMPIEHAAQSFAA
jgi:hypothetical protein